MNATRPVKPTDLVALVSFEGKVYRNEARPWERLGQEPAGPHPLESAIEQWFSFATGRQTWVHVHGQTIRGLASARRRGGGISWEVDCLIAADTGVCLGLLDRLCDSGARSGVEKVFVRLEADSELLLAVQQAGFFAYTTEQLWRWETPASPAPAADLPLRQRTAVDDFPLFRLYNAAVPASVRRAEAPTLREWLGARDLRRGRRARELVLERDGAIVGWLSIARADHATRLALLLHPDEQGQLDEILAAILSRVGDRRPILCLVPDYAAPLASALAARGFQHEGKYVSLVRRLARPVVTTEALPQGAQQTYTIPTLLTKP